MHSIAFNRVGFETNIFHCSRTVRATLTAFIVHGAIFLHLKSTDPIRDRALSAIKKVGPVATVMIGLFVVTTYLWTDAFGVLDLLTLGVIISNNALYTTGLGLSNITKIDKRPMVLVSGILGTVLALWLYDNFVGWLSFLNATLPPSSRLAALA